jgi:fatty acid amide hydrolase 2
MPFTAGLYSRRGVRATSDATAVARLRAAGAIPIGVTNTSELCMWMESSNNVYGRTNNPYDPTRLVGGSSGGEGAIVGSGASPFGLGSDIGGSIRMPAFFNGVFGHKPSGGLVPGSGQFPAPTGAAWRYLTTGPLCRRAEDLFPLLKILAGPDGQDPGTEPMTLGDPTTVDLTSLNVVSVEGSGVLGCEVDEELLQAQRGAAEALRARGATVKTLVPSQIPELAQSGQIWSTMMAQAGGPSFAALMEPNIGGGVKPGRELLKWMTGGSHHTLPAIALALIEQLPMLHDEARARATIEISSRLRARLIDEMGTNGVLLYPSYTKPAPRHHAPLRWPVQWTYTAILNVMQFPVTQVPLGLSMDGLPLGVQVASVHGADHRTIAVARALERAFGGWQVPPIATANRWAA